MKKKAILRIISSCLSIMMLFTMLPLNAIALDNGSIAVPNGNTDLTPEPTVIGDLGESEKETLEYDVWDGTVATGLVGKGNEDDPYLISNGAELMYIAYSVNSENGYRDFEDKYFELANNIDMDMFGSNSDKTWIPIGVFHMFKGHFDGNGHEIINLNIQFNGEYKGSYTAYIGFFGFIYGGSVKNLGIRNYKIDQNYDRDTEIGAIAARIGGEAFVENCYAVGEIGATFKDSNPVTRGSGTTHKYTSVPDTLSNKNNAPSDNPPVRGEGVIIDLTNASSVVNKTMTIGGDVSAVRIIGRPGITYTGFNIVVSSHEYFSLLIELDNAIIKGNSANGTIYCDNGRDIFISSIGGTSKIIAADGASAVNVKNSDVTILGTADLEIIGGRGLDGTALGQSGKSGNSAIICQQMNIDIDGSFTAQGGNGGNGAQGLQGETGRTNYTFYWVEDVHSFFGHIQTIHRYNQAFKGGIGEIGGNGGIGGLPISCTDMSAKNGTIKLVFGDGGNGGKGGTGGTGGAGANYSGEKTGFSFLKCYDPGQGGDAGDGGVGGYGGVSVTAQYIIDYDNITVVGGKNGSGGAPGDAGTPGKGGLGGKTTGPANEHSADDASPGGPGNVGVYGTVPTVPLRSITYTQDLSKIVDANLTRASLKVGGLVCAIQNGYWEDEVASYVKNSASVVNDLSADGAINLKYNYNTVRLGQFAQSNSGEVINSIVTYYDNGVLKRYDNSTWFSHENHGYDFSKYPIGLLNDSTDEIGLVYNNDGISTENTYMQSCAVIDYIGETEDVVIPNYVFGGRFINSVTAIRGREYTSEKDPKLKHYGAFEGSEYAEKITVGANVEKIGDYAFAECKDLETVVLGDKVSLIGCKLFYNCNDLESITIGASLTKIPELENGETLFGIDKSNSNLREYIVSDGNAKFSSENGILYENFKVLDDNLKVAVIDVPRRAEFTNSTYSPSSYIVRIYPYAFSFNTNLEKVHLDYIREVGTGAFSYCSALKEVVFGELTETDETITILDVEYPKATEKYSTFVGTSAFENCSNLQKVNLDSSALTKIGSKAFYNCATAENAQPMSISLGKYISMLSATEDELKNNVQYTTEELLSRSFASAFKEAKVREFVVHENNATFKSINGVLFYRSDEKVEGSDKKVLWLAAYPRNAVAENYSLINETDNKYVVIYVSPEAFSGAVNLKTLTVGNGVTQIGREAFTNLTSLHTLNIGKDVIVLGGDNTVENLFDGCGALQKICVDAENTKFSDVDGVLFDKTQEMLIKYPEAKPGREYTTPYSVTVINDKAFMGNNLLSQITISNKIESVGDYAFYNCPNLSFIYFEKGDAPFDTAKEIKSSNAFYTTNSRVVVAFGDSVENEKWKLLSTDEANETYYSEIATTDGKHPRMFRVSEYTARPTNVGNNGYYAVVVLDKNGDRLNNINVAIGEEQRINTINGISMFYNLPFDQSYFLKVFDNQGEYFPFENAEFYLDKETCITYITLSKVPTVSGVNVDYNVDAADKIKEILTDEAEALIVGDGHKVVDINSETAKINTCFTNSFNVRVNCGMDLGVTIKGFHVIQNGKTVKAVEDANILASMVTYKSDGGKRFAEVYFNLETKNLELEQDVYIVVDFSDESTVKTKLNIHIFELNFYNVDLLWFKNGLNLEISDELRNVLKGFGQELTIVPKPDGPIEIGVKVEPDSFKVALSYGDEIGKKDEEEKKKTLSDQWAEFRDAFKYNKKNPVRASEKLNEGKPQFSIEGFVDFKYKGLDENGIKDYQVDAGISGSISFEYNFGTTVTFVVVPVRIECKAAAGGELSYTLTFDREAEQFISDNWAFELKGELNVSAGVGCKLVSIGVYGSAEMVFALNILPEFNIEKWTLTGDVGAYFKYNGLFIKYKATWSLLKGLGIDATWVIYENGDWWFESNGQVAAVSEVSLASAMFDESAYEIAPSAFDPEVMTFSLRGIEEEEENAYSGIDPKMIRVGDLVYIVYQDDLNGYSDKYDEYNYQKIVYQIYNTKDCSFSEVYVLDDNGYADGAYEVYYDGKDAVVVYTQVNKKLTSDNIEDMAGYVGSMEVKTAVLKKGAFVPAKNCLTSDKYYDMNLRVGKINGKITAIWVQNTENTMFGTTDTNGMSVWYSAYDNGIWSKPQCLNSGINTITDIEIGSDGVVYITDTNNDLTTVGTDKITEGYDDRLITVLDLNGNVTFATVEEAAYHDVSYFADEIVYYIGNNLYSIDTDYDTVSAYFEEAIAELPEDYTVLCDSYGNIKAILFVDSVTYGEENKANGSNVFAIFCDGNKWGKPIQLTEFGEGYYVSAFDAVDFGNEMLLSVLLSEVEFTDEASYELNNYSSVNRFDTMWVEYPTDCVLGEIEFDYKSVVPDSETTLMVSVTNNSYLTLKSAPVAVSRNGKTVYDTVITDFFDGDGNILENGLLSGETGYVKVKFNVGKEGTSKNELSYTVNFNGQAKDVQLWYSDLAVYGKQIVIGNTYHVVVRVTNDGYVPAKGVIKATLNNVELDIDLVTDELKFGESQYFTIPLENTLVGDGSDLVIISVVADMVDNEYLKSNNDAKINIATDELLNVSADSADVWLSDTAATIDRSKLSDKTVLFEEKYSLESVTVNGANVGNELYSISGNAVTLKAEAIANKYGNGIYTVEFMFTDGSCDSQGNTVYRYAKLTLKLTQTFTVSFVVDGVVIESQILEAGAVPSFNGEPVKQGDARYSYKFDHWDKDFTPVYSDVTYTAWFVMFTNRYTVSFIVDGTVYSAEYDYGTIPEYTGSVEKPADDKYSYRFNGWDKEISAVTENVTYTAQFEGVLLGRATVTNSEFKTAWGCEFFTTISLENVRHMTDTTITIYYDRELVELSAFSMHSNVTFVQMGDGAVTFHIDGLKDGVNANVANLTFVTKKDAPFGSWNFLKAVSEENITNNFSALTICQMGDVNMDGFVNTIDAAMVQMYTVGKIGLTDIQKIYANVNGDYNVDGTVKINNIDAAMIQQYAVKKLEMLGVPTV